MNPPSSNASSIRAVFFDFAGTLFSDRALRDVHLQQLRHVAELVRPDGSLTDAELRAAYRQAMGSAYRQVAAQPGYLHRTLFGAAFAAMAEALGGRLSDEQERELVDRQYAATIDAARLRPDCVDTLVALREAGLHLQLVSNIDDEQLHGLVDAFGIAGHFDALTSSQEAGACKPDPAIYAYALAKAGCAPGEVLFVGDSVDHDIAGPAAVGMHTAWLTADAKPLPADRAPATPPDLVIETLGQLVTALSKGSPMSIPSLRADGKVVVITGASKGLGRAMALGFAEAGADLVVSSRKLEPCEEVAAEIRAMGRQARAVACHVGDWDQCDALIEAAVAAYGRIDVLINNAGIAPVPPSLAGITSDLFDKTIAVNLKGPLRLSAQAAPHMPPGSAIINISSKASLHPGPTTVVYAAAKAGLNALTKASSQEFAGQGIRVNCIVCGTFDTDSLRAGIPTAEAAQAMASRVSVGRIAAADEIVGTALYLASDASSYLDGELIVLDGGGS